MSRITRIFSIALILFFLSHAAKAQTFIGGNIGITDGVNGSGLCIAPEIGMHLSPFLTIGAMASFYSNPVSMGVTPYARFQLLNLFNGMYIFASANLPVNFAENYLSVGLTVRPGLAIRLGQNVALTAQIGNFGFVTTGMNREIHSSWIGRIDADNISIGITYNLWR